MKNLSITESSAINPMELSTKEAYIAALEAFTDDSQGLPEDLENLFKHIAKTGDTIVAWDKLKKVFVCKLKLVVDDFNSTNPYIAGKINANCENEQFSEMRESLITLANGFEHPPFTFQRVCELIINPKKNYTKCEKFMRAVEKNLRVVTAWSYTPRRVSDIGSTELQMNGSSNASNDSLLNKSPPSHKSPPTTANVNMECINPTTSQTTNHVKNDTSKEMMIESSANEKASDENSDVPVPISKITISNTSQESNSKVEPSEDVEVDDVKDGQNKEGESTSSSKNDSDQSLETGDDINIHKTESLLPDVELAPCTVTNTPEKTALVESPLPELTQVNVDSCEDKLECSTDLGKPNADNPTDSKNTQPVTKRKLDSEDESDQSTDENNAKRPKND